MGVLSRRQTLVQIEGETAEKEEEKIAEN